MRLHNTYNLFLAVKYANKLLRESYSHLLNAIISLAYRNSTYQIRHFILFCFSKVLSDYIATHAESNDDYFCFWMPLTKMAEHVIEISCSSYKTKKLITKYKILIDNIQNYLHTKYVSLQSTLFINQIVD